MENSIRNQKNVNNLIALVLKNKAPEFNYKLTDNGVKVGYVLIATISEALCFVNLYKKCN